MSRRGTLRAVKAPEAERLPDETPSGEHRPLDDREREFARALIRRIIDRWQDEQQET